MNFTIIGFIVTALILSLAFESEGCKCKKVHPQVHYCASEYVIVAKILSEHEIDDDKKSYSLDIRKIWRATDEAFEYLQSEELTTSTSSAACGVNLKIGTTYVIFGSGTHIGSCQYIHVYSKVPALHKSFLKRQGKRGCKCKVKNSINF